MGIRIEYAPVVGGSGIGRWYVVNDNSQYLHKTDFRWHDNCGMVGFWETEAEAIGAAMKALDVNAVTLEYKKRLASEITVNFIKPGEFLV